jgi:hypothetical protein
MAVIKTPEALRAYILRQLGSPILTIEVDDSQIYDAISDAVQKFSFKAMAGEETKIVLFEKDPGRRDYVLDDRVQSVTELHSSSSFGLSLNVGGGFVLDASYFANGSQLTSMIQLDISSMTGLMSHLSTIQSIFDVPLAFEFNYHTKILRFFEEPTTNKIMIKVSLEYEPKAVDNIYNSPWIKEYATALVKRQWGNNLGKFSGSLVNGSTLNYDRILSEAQSEIERLSEELDNTYSSPLGMYVF